MANIVSEEHDNLFKKFLQTVDSAGARATFSHVWDTLKEVAAKIEPALPVVEAAVETAIPAAAPVLEAAQVVAPLAEKSIEELQQTIAEAQAALQQKQATPVN